MSRFSFDSSDSSTPADLSDQFGGGPYPVGLYDSLDSPNLDQLDFDVHDYDILARGHSSEQDIVYCEPAAATGEPSPCTGPNSVGGCPSSNWGVPTNGPGPFVHAAGGSHGALTNFFSNQLCPCDKQCKLDICITSDQDCLSLEPNHGGFGPTAGVHGHVFPSGWYANLPVCQEVPDFRQTDAHTALPADGLKRHGKSHGESLNRWDDEWKTCFLKAVLSLGIGNAKTMSILEFMRMECPGRHIEKKHVESYWQNFRRKLRAQYGLSRVEVPKNEHLPEPKDIPGFLRHLANRWLRQ
ncbi:Hypothetical protein GLP15_3387 [Giardia lamblia P15]|uniref:Uncharacterized protein n=1 Tax=Giardia intestinalis (strain P15) TaxID=658858 RepID=E1EVY3_GIAIA|nr:Hypothetical protein GLP15_3387 [Giardia lamblia P15]